MTLDFPIYRTAQPEGFAIRYLAPPGRDEFRNSATPEGASKQRTVPPTGLLIHVLATPKDQSAQVMFVFLDFVLNKECASVARFLWADCASIHNLLTGCPQMKNFITKNCRCHRTAIVGPCAIRFNPLPRSWLRGDGT
jgi:hypothetical protein